MKPSHPESRKSAIIPNSRWLAYATAGAASTFACAHPQTAEATIHYSGPIHQEFDHNLRLRFPLASGAKLEFSHVPAYSYSSFTKFLGSAFVNIGARLGGSINGTFRTCFYSFNVASASKLNRGDVMSSRPFVPNGGALATGSSQGCSAHHKGQFLQPGDGFIGFKFNAGRGDQYGWAHVRALGLIQNKFELIDYAYGDPGDRIRAGQRAGGHNSMAFESLGGLALGAIGLLAWRRRRSPR